MKTRTFDVILSEEAESDLDNSFICYEIQKQKLGVDFIKQIDVGLRKIKKSPRSYRVVYKNIRRFIIKKFPFSIYYFIDDPSFQIKIIAVFHNSRNPQIWKKRK